MEFEREAQVNDATEHLEFAQPSAPRKSLEILRDTEAFLRKPTVAAIVPIVSPKLAQSIKSASLLAEDTLREIAELEQQEISDWELRPYRIRIALSFVGFGALMIIVLLLYVNTLYPQLSSAQQLGKYWHQYIWFVCLGVTGMFLLGREAMRPINQEQKSKR